MQLNPQFEGILKANGYKPWEKQTDLKFKRDYSLALKKAMEESKQSARHDIASKFKSKKGFLNAAVRFDTFDSQKDKFAAGHIYSKIPYFHVFEKNGTIKANNKKMIIPITHVDGGKRRDRKQFKKMLDDLFATKSFYFKKINGTTILFAKITKQNTKSLQKEKSFYNRNNIEKINGKTVKKASFIKLKEGSSIPVGVCVDEIKMKKRYNIDEKLHNKTLEKTIKNFEQIYKKS